MNPSLIELLDLPKRLLLAVSSGAALALLITATSFWLKSIGIGFLGLPGSAIVAMLGRLHGNPSPEWFVMIVFTCVNALVYGILIFSLLSLLARFTPESE